MTSPLPKLLNLKLSFDRQLIWRKGASVRYLMAEIQADQKKIAGSASRVPLNLALVIDASGSMEGPPLAAATQAAVGVTKSLEEEDRLSIVSFASEMIVHLEATAMDSRGKAQAKSVLKELATRGSTNLAAGWTSGCECVAKEMASRGLASGRVILLSDGHANEGIVDPLQLREIADNLRRRGVFTSTVGIGDGYSEDQLQVIAEHGGGRLHDAERPEEIVEVVLGELSEVFSAVAEDVQLELEPPPGVEVECLGGYPASSQEGRLVVCVGGFIGGAKRQIVLKVKSPAGDLGQVLDFAAKLVWTESGSKDRVQGEPSTASLKFVRGSENSAQPRDEVLSLLVAKTWQSDLVRKVVAWNREGDFESAKAYLTEQIRWFEKYCHGLAGAEALVDQLRHVLRRSGEAWSPRSRKEINLQHYKGTRGDRDLRSTPRASWEEFLPE